jgi:glucose/arabinose dehydrogenase
LGGKYVNNIFVGDFNNGHLYYLQVDQDRTDLILNSSGLADRVVNDKQELSELIFGTGFGGITDIETGPDGFLYVLTFSGDLYRIVPETLPK